MPNARFRSARTGAAWFRSALVASALTGISCNACNFVDREVGDRFKDHETNLWTSASDCERQAATKRRADTRHPRIATWNVRYFPDSQESAGANEHGGTHVKWLACAIASLDPDIVAVQEFKNTPPALKKQQELIQSLNERTKGNWQLALSTCEPPGVQHPGFLYDASRVTATNLREIEILNPGNVCNNYASPGFGGYFKINGGPDFHMIAVHFAAGDAGNAMEDRKYSVSVMSQVTADAKLLVPDDDIIFTGDFNTSGCEGCDPSVDNQQEVQSIAEQANALTPPLTVLPASESCSRQDDKGSPLLDHFVFSSSMREVPQDSVAHVSGICEAMGCSRLREWYEDAHQRLSDHCPVLLDLSATDDD